MKPNHADRNKEIAQALAEGAAARELAARYSVTPSTIYRAAATARAQAERFAVSDKPARPMKAGGPTFAEIATPGLRHFGGRVDEEYDRVFKSLQKRVALYREMGDDPIAAAVLQAVKMTIKRVSWHVQTDGTSEADQQATEFLEAAMHDMSQAWTDVIDQALAMLQYGFYPAELVYKRRLGPDPIAGATRSNAASKYDDGRIGWRKWTFISPDSLATGDEWAFDELGGLQGIYQFDMWADPPRGKVFIPIDKAILFRTTAEKGNPESRALFRAMYIPWYFKHNLEEIEAISAERMGAGLPIIYAGDGVGKGSESTSDASLLQDILKNVRVDEQMGVFLPFPKMTADGKGVLFELQSPPSRGVVNFHETISRHEQRMAMVGLAQFIHLGMNQVGARALGESSQDFFTLAVSGWADGLADTINRYAVERLFRLNYFPGLTTIPYITHEAVAQTNIGQVADYVNKLVGAQLLTATPELEHYLRELADLPIDVDLDEVYAERKRAAELRASQPKVMVQPTPQTEPVKQDPEIAGATRSNATRSNAQAEQASANETFAALRGAGQPGARTKEINTVNAYQRELERIYAEWADDAATQLAEADPDERGELLAALLLLLLALLKKAGRENLPGAVGLGLNGQPYNPDVAKLLATTLEENEGYLSDSLLPAIGDKLKRGLSDGDIALALAAGGGAAALSGLLATMSSRVGSYAGAWWGLYNQTVGDVADELGKPVYWRRDPRAQHCGDCLQFGDREYASYQAMLAETGGVTPANGTECGNGCRCVLEF